MSDTWRDPGQVQVERNDAVVLLRVSGNFHRDLVASERDAREEQVRSASDAIGLVVDLSDVTRLDSWGEGVIADVIDDVIGAGGRAGVIHDETRPHHVRSLKLLLKRHEERVRFDIDEAALCGWVAEEQ